MASVYEYEDGTFSFSQEDKPLKTIHDPNDEITVYTSEGYQNIGISKDGTQMLNPDFKIVEMQGVHAYEAAAHNLYDNRFNMYGDRSVVENMLAQFKEMTGPDKTATSALNMDGVVFMDNAVNGMTMPDQNQTVGEPVTPAEPMDSGVILMDDAVNKKPTVQSAKSEPVLQSEHTGSKSSVIPDMKSEGVAKPRQMEKSETKEPEIKGSEKEAPAKTASESDFTKDAVVLHNVPVSQVFKTKRDGTKIVRVMSNSVPSGSFSFSSADSFIHANRDENNKVTSYDINIGFPGYYKDVSYKDNGVYKHVNMDVLELLSRFQSQQQDLSVTKSDVKPVYLNFIDRGNVKDSKTEGRSNVYVPYPGSEDGFLRIQVQKDQVLLSKNNGSVVPGKFNIRLDGNAVQQAFVLKNGEITEVEGGIAAKDILAGYTEMQRQSRDMGSVSKETQSEVQNTQGVPVYSESQPVPAVSDQQSAVQVFTSETPVSRSEAAASAEDDTPMFSNLSDVMSFDGGFGM